MYLSALRSTKTVVGSGEEAPCKQMAMFWRQPKEVETARGERPSGENRVVKLSKILSNFYSSNTFLVLFTCCKEQSLVAPQQQQQEFGRSPTLHLGSLVVEQNHPGEEKLIVIELKTILVI